MGYQYEGADAQKPLIDEFRVGEWFAACSRVLSGAFDKKNYKPELYIGIYLKKRPAALPASSRPGEIRAFRLRLLCFSTYGLETGSCGASKDAFSTLKPESCVSQETRSFPF